MDSLKLACSSSAYTDTSLTDAIHQIASIGYPAIEIRAGHERLTRELHHENDTRHVKEALSQHSISVSNIAIGDICPTTGSRGNEDGAYLSDNVWTDRRNIDRIKHYIGLARELGCPSVSVSPGRVRPGMSENTPVPSMIEGLTEVTKFARGLGVAVGITYGPGLVLNRMVDLEPLLLKCRGLKISFHAGNSHLACETPCNIAKEFKHRINHIQIADIGYGNRPYLVPGAGEIEWISFFKTLRWIRYRGFVTVDLSSYRDTPDLAATRAFFYLTNIINGLKQPRLKDSPIH